MEGRAGLVLDIALVAWGLLMLVGMKLLPGDETLPYHLLFLAFTLVYGLRLWPLLPTAAALTILTLSTGFVLLSSYGDGYIDGAELWEVPLMPALLAAMVWHARTRAAAQRTLEALAHEREASLEREREFFRNTSHAIRTPVTIARGHLELLGDDTGDPQVDDSVSTALRQLERMTVLSSRLLRLAQFDAGHVVPPQQISMRPFLLELGRGWMNTVPRRWSVVCDQDAAVCADPESLAMAIDALVENAVNFTADDGMVEITGSSELHRFRICVADDGPGIDPQDLDHVMTRFWHRRPPNGPMGSGLGLAMAAATAQENDGELRVRNRDGGGACFELLLPMAA